MGSCAIIWLLSQLGADIDGEAANDNSGYSVSMNSTGPGRDRAGGNDGTASNASCTHLSYNGSAWTQLGSDIDGEAANDIWPTRLDEPGR